MHECSRDEEGETAETGLGKHAAYIEREQKGRNSERQKRCLTPTLELPTVHLRFNIKKVGEYMPEVIVRKGEPIDRALKRLKSKLDSEGILDEVRRLRAFETPVQKSRRKAKNNAKRAKLKIRFNLSLP